MECQFRFVTTTSPSGRVSSQTRKTNHSHVMRHVHQKKRLSRIQQNRDAVAVAGADADEDAGAVRQVQTEVHVPAVDPRTAQIQRYGSSRDPFSTLARPLSSEEYSLLNNYVHVVMPSAIGHCGLYLSDTEQGRIEILKEWVSLAVGDPTFMVLAILLKTCRYILRTRPDDPVIKQMILHYKQICLQAVRDELQRPSYQVTLLSIAKSLAFAIDEVTAGEVGNAKKHVQGIMAMLDSQNEIATMHMQGLVGRMYRKFLEILSLQAETEAEAGEPAPGLSLRW
ncbi:hypothetical protein LIA77_05841 [Sarocladium implicatum]|nr:hypothetical protein LIA77_05841 [Sarocladium implicatum]